MRCWRWSPRTALSTAAASTRGQTRLPATCGRRPTSSRSALAADAARCQQSRWRAGRWCGAEKVLLGQQTQVAGRPLAVHHEPPASAGVCHHAASHSLPTTSTAVFASNAAAAELPVRARPAEQADCGHGHFCRRLVRRQGGHPVTLLLSWQLMVRIALWTAVQQLHGQTPPGLRPARRQPASCTCRCSLLRSCPRPSMMPTLATSSRWGASSRVGDA